MALNADRIRRAYDDVARRLLAERVAGGYWRGELSSSALSTATAVTALALAGESQDQPLIAAGLDWLARNRNTDGGWGDTVRSRSNLSTTVLAWCAFAAGQAEGRYQALVAGAARWIERQAGGPEPDRLAAAVQARYGADRSFAVPILTMGALTGRLGEGLQAWRLVPPLPFELAALPRGLFRFLRLPVVSYALPALIAIGQVRHHRLPPRCPVTRALRDLARGKTLAVLETLQPAGGGFLEAAPLTSFVAMCLGGAGRKDHPVARRAVGFLRASARADGSWPIDTDLATWVTTLSVHALAAGGALPLLPPEDRRRLVCWLLGQQHRTEHPYTRAAPGGWAWTDLPGAVPDADDTAGALRALRHLGEGGAPVAGAAAAGVRWLLDLQNRDGGLPTFCRGWGALPFDRSAPDLTAHALRAWRAWRDDLPAGLRRRIDRASARAVRFLARAQRADGAWLPLWFGNESAPDERNPTYGTARVLTAMAERDDAPGAVLRGLSWLTAAQNGDGGWGGAPGAPSSVEETAAAVEALAALRARPIDGPPAEPALEAGADWLLRHTTGPDLPPAPIGLYFARLWYFERLYPPVLAAAALGRCARAAEHPPG